MSACYSGVNDRSRPVATFQIFNGEQKSIAESERSDKVVTVRNILRAVLAGTLGGAFLPLCLLLPMLLFQFLDPAVSQPWGRWPLLLYPLAFGFAFALSGMVLIMLPATYLLGRVSKESPGAYATLGAVAGGLATFGFFGVAGAIFIASGTLGGALMGYDWGSARSPGRSIH